MNFKSLMLMFCFSRAYVVSVLLVLASRTGFMESLLPSSVSDESNSLPSPPPPPS